MNRCDLRGSLPRSCAEAFGRLGERLAGIERTTDAIHDQTRRIAARVEETHRRTERHQTRLALLDRELSALAGSRRNWLERLWKLCVAIALLALGWWLKS